MNLPADIQREYLQASARTGVTAQLERAILMINHLVNSRSPIGVENFMHDIYQRMDEPSTTKARKWEIMEECEFTELSTKEHV